MTVQTTYDVDHKAGVPGLIVDSSPARDVVTKIAREAIPFGVAVVLGSGDGDEGCSLPDLTGEITAGTLLGVSVRDPQLPSTDGYAIGDPVLILTGGRIWVDTEDAVAAKAAAFVRFGAGGDQGAFRSDDDTATAVAGPTMQFLKTTAGAGLTQVELNLPAG